MSESGVGESPECVTIDQWRSKSAPNSSTGRRSASPSWTQSGRQRFLALVEAKARLLRFEAEQAEVPKMVSSVEEAVPPVEWGRRGPEIARGIDASARRSQSRSCCLILTKFRRGCKNCCRRGLQNVMQELRSQCPPIHKTWNGGYQSNTELRDAIEFGDKESILALTDLIQQGVTICRSQCTTWVV